MVRKKEKRLIRKTQVLDRTSISNSSTLYYFISKGMFPSPVKIGKRTVAWREEEVDAWIENREYSIITSEEVHNV